MVENNTFAGNVSFVCPLRICGRYGRLIIQIGSYGPNCTTGGDTPNAPTPLIYQISTNTNDTISTVPFSSSGSDVTSADFNFINGTVLGMTCFLPPGTDQIAWPYGGGYVNSGGVAPSSTTTSTSSQTSTASPTGTSKSAALSTYPDRMMTLLPLVLGSISVCLSAAVLLY